MGRAGRGKYWLCMIAVAAWITFGAYTSGKTWHAYEPPPLSYAKTLAMMPPAFFVIAIVPWAYGTILRFHDLNMSGWWTVCLALVFVAAGQVALVGLHSMGFVDGLFDLAAVVVLAPIFLLGALPGKASENRFGPPP